MSHEEPGDDILLYAELLPNIRQISVGCSLPTPSSAQTRLDVSSDGTRLSVNHNGLSKSLQLPGPVQGHLRPPVRQGQRDLTFRIPVLSPGAGYARPAAEPQPVPWSARDIVPGSAIKCRQCAAVLVSQDALPTWKDLPSENWAEMMEFWHCHKPHEHKEDGHAGHDHQHLTTRGYGASSRISAQAGLGFVDLTSFLVALSDLLPSSLTATGSVGLDGRRDHLCVLGSFLGCGNLRSIPELVKTPVVSENPVAKPSREDQEGQALMSTPQELAICSGCQSRLGVIAVDTGSVSLFKWQVSITAETVPSEAATKPTSREPSLAHCVSAMLLATIARTGCSKSLMMPLKGSELLQTADSPHSQHSSQSSPSATRYLHIWLFNGNITFSSSRGGSRDTDADADADVVDAPPQPAIKVLFRLIGEDEADRLIHSMTSDTQDIRSMPADAIDMLVGLLRESSSYLPLSERVFREWSVGLVPRWEE